MLCPDKIISSCLGILTWDPTNSWGEHFATQPFLKNCERLYPLHLYWTLWTSRVKIKLFLNNLTEIFYMGYFTLKMSTISWMFISGALCVHSYILQYPNYSWTVGVIGFKFCMMLPNMPVNVNIYIELPKLIILPHKLPKFQFNSYGRLISLFTNLLHIIWLAGFCSFIVTVIVEIYKGVQ